MSGTGPSSTKPTGTPSASKAKVISPKTKAKGTSSTTKPKGTSPKGEQDHKAEALLVASCIKNLAIKHEEQLRKGSDHKIPAAALKKIRLLNKMLSTIELEPRVWQPVDHALRRKSPRPSSQKKRPLSELFYCKAYSSPASDVDGCCDALRAFHVSPSKTETVPVSSPEEDQELGKNSPISLSEPKGTISSPPPTSPPVLPATPITTSPPPTSSAVLPTTTPTTSPPPSSPPVLGTSSTVTSPPPRPALVLPTTTPDIDMSEASSPQDAEVAKADFMDDEVMAEDVVSAQDIAEPDTEMAEAKARDEDSVQSDDEMAEGDAREDGKVPDVEMADTKALEDDSAQKPDSEMAEAREDINVQSPPEEAMADRPVAVTETTSVVDSKMGDVEDPPKSSTEVEAVVVEPAKAVTAPEPAKIVTAPEPAKVVTAPSPAPIPTPASAVSPSRGFTDDEQQIFERMKHTSSHHSKGVAAYEEMLELPWSDVEAMKKVIKFVVKSPVWGKGDLNAAKKKVEAIYTNRQPNTGVVDRLLFTSAIILRRTVVKPRPLPSPHKCSYESGRGVAATQRSVATVALRKNMGAREELLTREVALRDMFVKVSMAMQDNFLKGKIPACISWAELQDIVEREEYEWHASKVGTTKDRTQRSYTKFVEEFLGLWTTGPEKFQKYFESQDPVDPLPQPHDSAALKHQAPSAIASAAQRKRID